MLLSIGPQHDPGRTSHMVYRKKGSGEPPSGGKAWSSEEPSHSDEPPSRRGLDRQPGGKAKASRQGSGPSLRQGSGHGGPQASGQAGPRTPSSECSVCGRRTWLFALPGQNERYCFACSADVATSVLLKTEIDAATLAGQDANPLVAEFAQLSTRLLARAQSA
jgi:hypothetical protein